MTQTETLKNKIYQNYGLGDKQKIWIVLYVKVNSESREFHRWMHLNTWAVMKHTQSYTHLRNLHQLTQRGERKGTLHKTLHCTRKTWAQTRHGNDKRGKPQEALFSWFLFSWTKHSQRGFINQWNGQYIMHVHLFFFSGTCGWFHPQKSINTIQILKEGILKHHDNMKRFW